MECAKGFMKAWAGCETVYNHTELRRWWLNTNKKVCPFSLQICHFLRVALTVLWTGHTGLYLLTWLGTQIHTEVFEIATTCPWGVSVSLNKCTDTSTLHSCHAPMGTPPCTIPFFEKRRFCCEASGQKWEIYLVWVTFVLKWSYRKFTLSR